MKISGQAILSSSPDQVFDAFHDPAVLTRTLPGCEQLTEVAPNSYAMTITAGVAAIKGTYDDRGKVSASQVEEKYCKPALLVLDAMEERRETEWEDRIITRLIGKRYDEELNTILISNQTIDEFKDRIGTTILDRIGDHGAIIECTWPSLRGRI